MLAGLLFNSRPAVIEGARTALQVGVPGPKLFQDVFKAWDGTAWRKRGEDYDAFKKKLETALLEQLLDHMPELRGREGLDNAPGLSPSHRLDDRSADERGRVAVEAPLNPGVVDDLVEANDRPADAGRSGQEGRRRASDCGPWGGRPR